MCFGFFEELLYFLEGSTSVWLSLTSVYLQDNNGMLCRAWKTQGSSIPAANKRKGRYVAGMLSIPLPLPAPTADITYTSSHSFLLSLNLVGLRTANYPSIRYGVWDEPSPPCLTRGQSTLSLPFISFWPQFVSPTLSPTATQKCLMTEHICSFSDLFHFSSIGYSFLSSLTLTQLLRPS